MRRTTPRVAVATVLLAGGWMTAAVVRPAPQTQDRQPEITVYKGPT